MKAGLHDFICCKVTDCSFETFYKIKTTIQKIIKFTGQVIRKIMHSRSTFLSFLSYTFLSHFFFFKVLILSSSVPGLIPFFLLSFSLLFIAGNIKGCIKDRHIMLNRVFIQSYFYYFIDFQQRSEELSLGPT